MELFDRFKLPLGLAIAGITFISAGIYYSLDRSSSDKIKFNQEFSASSSASILVHIAGEVVAPGVYTLSAGSRINDLINYAGGLTSQADTEFIDKNINLAAILKDGAKIYIPKKGENPTSSVAGFSKENSPLINLNNASRSDLESLPDIGPVRAQKIIDNRPYFSLEELVEKKIISPSVLDKIKDKITL